MAILSPPPQSRTHTSFGKSQCMFFKKRIKAGTNVRDQGTDCHQNLQASKCYLTCIYQDKKLTTSSLQVLLKMY